MKAGELGRVLGLYHIDGGKDAVSIIEWAKGKNLTDVDFSKELRVLRAELSEGEKRGCECEGRKFGGSRIPVTTSKFR